MFIVNNYYDIIRCCYYNVMHTCVSSVVGFGSSILIHGGDFPLLRMQHLSYPAFQLTSSCVASDIV